MYDENKISPASTREGEILILSDGGESFSVLLKEKDTETGKITKRKAKISHAAFESGVKSGLLVKR
ncbi:MAG: hypothetical protein IJT42_00545 [Treponema sp.]|nr:hypothetical protein [Treponema sp.]